MFSLTTDLLVHDGMHAVMDSLWQVFGMLIRTVVSAAAGGAAAGIIFAAVLVSAGFDPPTFARAAAVLLGSLFLILLTVGFGAVFGTVIGFLPVLILGAVLERSGTQHVAAWTASGAAVGCACSALNLFGLDQIGFGFGPAQKDLTVHWMVAGAVAMTVYWALSTGRGRSSHAGPGDISLGD